MRSQQTMISYVASAAFAVVVLFASTVAMAEEPVPSPESDVQSRGVTPLKVVPLNPAILPGRLVQQARTWDRVWDLTWQAIVATGPIQIAPTVASQPVCQGNLGFDVLVRNTIHAMTIRKYGDAANFLGLYQDRTLCLTPSGVRKLDLALTLYVMTALKALPPDQATIAVQGALTLGFLTFDQLLYSAYSVWQLGLKTEVAQLLPLVRSAPADLPVFLYDFDQGQIVARVQPGLREAMLMALADPSRFGGGLCSLLEMADVMKTPLGFRCPLPSSGQTAAGSISKGGKGGLAAIPGGMSTGQDVRCVLGAANATGVRGQLTCVKKAMAGFVPSAQDLLKGPADPAPIALDKICAIGKGAEQPKPSAEQTKKTEEQKKQEQLEKQVAEQKKQLEQQQKQLEQQQKQLEDQQKQLAQQQKEMNELKARIESVYKDEVTRDTVDYEIGQMRRENVDKIDERLKEVEKTIEQAKKGIVPAPGPKRTVGGDNLTDPCSARSNAAARAQAVFQCLAKPDMNAPARTSPLTAGTQQPSSGNKQVLGTTESAGTKKGGNLTLQGGKPPVLDPNLIHVDPSIDPAVGASLSGPLACMVQGGDLVRASFNDPHCDARMRCVGNQPCPCNRQGGLVGERPQDIRPAQATPDCIDGKCDGPRPSGTPNPTPKPNLNFGGPPAPPPR